MRKGFRKAIYDYVVTNVQGGINMSDISNIYSNVGAAYAKSAEDTEKAVKEPAATKSKVPGKTVGNVKLSEKAEKYYEELRKKFHNMEFILVSEDEKENAKANASSYAKHGKLVVLVDEAKIERMAEDATYRAKIEGLIEKSSQSFAGFAESVKATGANIKGFGMQVNDNGTTSFFAVLEKSSEAYSKHIEEKRAEHRAEKKAEAKKEAKAKEKERIENAREAKQKSKTNVNDGDEIITANSLEELLQKISDRVQLAMSDSVVTEAERKIGQNIDFSA